MNPSARLEILLGMIEEGYITKEQAIELINFDPVTQMWSYINPEPSKPCYHQGQWYDHDVVDSGFKVSECRRCKCKMVFEYPVWVEVKSPTEPAQETDYERNSWMINPFYRESY